MNIKGSIQFLDYKVIELNYKLLAIEKNKSISINPQIVFKHKIDKNIINVYLGLIVEKKEDDNTPFEINVGLVGNFSLNEEDEKMAKKMLPNAVAILFPYLRNIVSSITLLANIEPYILPTINIVKLLGLEKENDKE